jgi:hypothetical protein
VDGTESLVSLRYPNEGGHAVLREKVAAPTDAERSALRDALFELEHA